MGIGNGGTSFNPAPWLWYESGAEMMMAQGIEIEE